MTILTLIVGFLVVLGPLVFVHELGHFLAAKRAGIRVIEFGFGFPPRMLKLWQGKGHLSLGSTRITIPANPKGLPPSAAEMALQEKDNKGKEHKTQHGLDAGDHVDILAEEAKSGEYVLRRLMALDPEKDDLSPVQHRTDQRLHVRGQLTEYVPGTIYSINWMPVGGFVRMLGEEDPSAPDSFAAAPKRWRALVLLAGPLMNILLALALFTGLGMYEPLTCRTEISAVGANTPAAAAGLQQNDIVLRADGEPMDKCADRTTGLNELGRYVRARGGQQVMLEIERDGQIIYIPVVPRAEGQYNPQIEGPLGIGIQERPLEWRLRVDQLPASLALAAQMIVIMVKMILSLPVLILSGAALTFIGPIGISQAGSEAIELSRQVGTLIPVLSLIGQVSVAVGLTNTLPLPALDGGRLLFVLVEWIRGRRIDPRKEMLIHVIGLGLLVLLIIVISYGDIVRLLSGQRLF